MNKILTIVGDTLKTKYVRRIVGLITCVVTIFNAANAATVAITNNTSTTPALASTYTSLASAITALNTVTVFTAPVTITCTGTETAPAGGYSISFTGTTSAANNVTIVGTGVTITAPTPQTSGNLNDAIFKIIGSDFVTLQGFTMQENAANTTATTATNNMTEFGIALFYASTTNGCQNITLQNNNITLNRTYTNTVGIYANSTNSATAVTTSATATGLTGGNHNLKIYSNTIQNVNVGIVVIGPTAVADINTGLEIGGSSTTGNTITNYGTALPASTFANVSGTVNGILARNNAGLNISYNTITSSVGGVNGTTVGIFGIQIPAPSTSFATSTIAYTYNINNNNFSIKQGATTTGAINGISILSTNASPTSIQNINNNDFNNTTYLAATPSGFTTFIQTTATTLTSNINNNTFTNINLGNSTGGVTLISQSFTAATNGTKNVNNNSIVGSFTKGGAGGTLTLILDNGITTTGSTSNCQNNNFSNITLSGATGITGISYTDGGTAPARTVSGNILNNWTTGTGAINAMNFTYWNGISSLANNSITNINGQGTITGITIGASANTATSATIANNSINNLTSSGTGGAVTGISCSNTSPLVNINGNTIYNLSSTGASAVAGIAISGSTLTNVFKNKIYGISGSNASSTINGIVISAGTTSNLYNNIVGGLTAPAANAANPVVGLNITGGTTVNAYYNTISIGGTSSGATFGSSAVFASASPNVTLRNNILVNTATYAGVTGATVAYRRSSRLTTNYNALSNNNLFYAGTPGSNNLLFMDSTIFDAGVLNKSQTIITLKSALASRDAASISALPNWMSVDGANANYLHINASIATGIESGGAPITGFNDDYDADIRAGSVGYLGAGTNPDIGADEGAFTPNPCVTPLAAVIATTTPNRCANQTISFTSSGTSSGFGYSYQWQVANVSGGPYSDVVGGTGATTTSYTSAPLAAGTYYYVLNTVCNQGPTSTLSNPITVVVNSLPTITIAPSSSVICNPGGSAVSLTASSSSATSYSWVPTSGLTSVNTATTSALPPSTVTYTISGTDAVGCVGTATALLTVANYPINVSATPAISNICSGAGATLNGSSMAPILSALGTGTLTTALSTTASTNFPNPYAHYYGGNKQQYLILASELTAMGLVAGSNINSIGFSVASVSRTDSLLGFQIAMGNTAATAITTFATGLSIVSPPATFTTNNLPGINTHALTTAFTWNGTSNLIIETSFSNNDQPPSGNVTMNYGSTSFSSCVYYRVDNLPSSALNSYTGTPTGTRLFRPNITFNYTSPITLGANYSWSPSATLSASTGLSVVASPPNGTTVYTLTASNSGCTATTTAQVTAGNPLNCNALTISGTACSGSRSVTSSPSGGGQPYSYSWKEDGNDIGGNTSSILTNTGSHLYEVTVTDNCGITCSTNTTIVTVQQPTAALSLSTPACLGGALNLIGTSNLSTGFLLSGPNSFSSTNLNETINSLTTAATGIYTLTVTNGECVSTATSSIIVNPLPTDVTIYSTNPTFCLGGSTNLSVSSSPNITSTSVYAVTAIIPSAEVASGTPTVLADGGVAVEPATYTGTLDDNVWDEIALPFSFNFYGNTYSSIRISTNGNVQFGAIVGTGGNTSSNSWTPQTIPTAGGNLDNFIAGAWMDQDITSTPYGKIQYFVNGVAPNRKFVVSFESCKVYLASDVNTSQIILNENGSIDVLLLGGGLLATTSKAIGIENATGTVGAFPTGRNSGTWTTAADEAWRFTPPSNSVVWSSDPTGYTSLVQNPTGVAPITSTNYIVTASNSFGCSASSSVTVTVNPLPTPTYTLSNVSCFAGTNGQITAIGSTTGTAPFTYQVDNIAYNSNGTYGASTHTITVADANGCTNNVAATITQPTQVTSSITSPASLFVCNGATTTYTVNAAGGTAPYHLSASASSTFSAASVYTVGGTPSGSTYTADVIDANGCIPVSNPTITITERSPVVATATLVSGVACNGGTATYTVTAIGGSNAGWAGTVLYTVTPNPYSPSSTFTNTVTDNEGCTGISTITIAEPTLLTASLASQTPTNCFGESNGTATIAVPTTGTAPYTYNGGASTTITGLNAGTHTITVKDANNCDALVEVTITQPTAVSASIISQTPTNCFGESNGSVLITATGGNGGYIYNGSSSNSIVGLNAGSHTVTVVDNKGCTVVVPVTILQPTQVISSITSPASLFVCNGATTTYTVNAEGGTAPYHLSASASSTFSAASVYTVGGTASGSTYTADVIDANGCTPVSNPTITITERSPVVATATLVSGVACNGGTATYTVTAIGGSNAGWAGTVLYTVTPNPSAPSSTFTNTVTDNEGCTGISTITIAEPTLLTASLASQTPTNCFGESNGTATIAVPTTGTAPYTYNGGASTTITSLNAGTHAISVKDANNCEAMVAVTITEPTAVSASITSQTPTNCFGESNGSVSITATGGNGGYTYNGSSSNSISGLSAGSNPVTVVDNKGCTVVVPVTILQPAVLSAAIASQTPASCNGNADGTATILATGGNAGYTYNGGSSAVMTSLAAGVNTFSVIDNKGCSTTVSATITQPAVLTINIAATNTIACYGGAGIYTVTVAGGNMPQTLYTINSLTSTVASPATSYTATAGTYTHMIQDAKGCQAINMITLTQPTALTASIAQGASIVCNGGTSAYTVTATGGTIPYRIGSSATFNPSKTYTVPFGTYTNVVTDANGCTALASGSAVFVNPPVLTVAASAIDSTVLVGSQLDLLSSSTGGAISYAWSGPSAAGNASTQNHTIAATTLADYGIYTVTVVNATGCTATSTVVIEQNRDVNVKLKVLLSGPLASSGLMNDDLRNFGLIPNMTPYNFAPYSSVYSNINNAGFEMVNPGVLSSSGADAIVDWVWVELRDKTNCNTIVGTRSALIQRDGDVVDMDGTSPVLFGNVGANDYYISVKHRNHSGIMGANSYPLSFSVVNQIDFTNTATPLYAKAAPNNNPSPLSGPTRTIGGKRAMYAGNAHIGSAATSKVIYYNSLAGSDRTAVYNVAGLAGSISGYSVNDVNMDGATRFNGLNPDRLVILLNCANSNFTVITEQTPN